MLLSFFWWPAIVTFFHFIVGWFGLGLVISIGTGMAWYFIPEVPWLTTKVRKLLLYICVFSGTGTMIFGAGYAYGRHDLKAQIQMEAKNAIDKGGAARKRATDQFNSGQLPEDWFRD